jgi:dihydrofolate reductase
MVSDDLKYELIVAHDDNRAIGHEMKLPWSIPSEFQYFVRMSSTPNDPNR